MILVVPDAFFAHPIWHVFYTIFGGFRSALLFTNIAWRVTTFGTYVAAILCIALFHLLRELRSFMT